MAKRAKRKSAKRISPDSVSMISPITGDIVWPYKPPDETSWRKIVKKVRTDNPLPFPVRVSRSPIAPDGTYDFGAAYLWYENGRVVKAHVWINSLQQRGMAIDSLLHEWAHLWCEVINPRPDLGDMVHDDLFWLTYGRYVAQWLK